MKTKHDKDDEPKEEVTIKPEDVGALEPVLAEPVLAEPALRFGTPPADMTTPELMDALGILFPREPRDPNRPRPVLDAIKAALTELVAQIGPAITPLLLQLLTQLLRGATPGSSQLYAGYNAHSHAEALQDRLAPKSGPAYSKSLQALDAAGYTNDNLLFEAIMRVFYEFASTMGPQLVPIILEVLRQLLGLPPSPVKKTE